MAVKNEKQYEALKEKGMSKERAARIANSPGASKRGGKSSGSGGSSKQGGTTAQKKAAGIQDCPRSDPHAMTPEVIDPEPVGGGQSAPQSAVGGRAEMRQPIRLAFEIEP